MRSAPGRTAESAISSFDFGINAAWLTASMTGQILLAWLKLLALDGGPGQGRAQDAAPCAARCGPPGTRRAAPPPEDPGDLAVG
jgi:hypothetical protein